MTPQEARHQALRLAYRYRRLEKEEKRVDEIMGTLEAESCVPVYWKQFIMLEELYQLEDTRDA